MEETKKEYINRIFLAAKKRGILYKQLEFAAQIKISRTAISKALQGDPRYLTDNLFNRVRLWALEQGLDENLEKAKPKQSDIIIPAAMATLYNNMSETIRIQAKIIANLQSTVSDALKIRKLTKDRNDEKLDGMH